MGLFHLKYLFFCVWLSTNALHTCTSRSLMLYVILNLQLPSGASAVWCTASWSAHLSGSWVDCFSLWLPSTLLKTGRQLSDWLKVNGQLLSFHSLVNMVKMVIQYTEYNHGPNRTIPCKFCCSIDLCLHANILIFWSCLKEYYSTPDNLKKKKKENWCGRTRNLLYWYLFYSIFSPSFSKCYLWLM